MRAHEIVTEIIDYTSHKEDAFQAIYNGIVEEISSLNKDLNEPDFKNIDLGMGSDSKKIKEILKNYISISLKYNIEAHLTALGRDILGLTKMPPKNSAAKLLKVELRDIGPDWGQANPANSKVFLNEKVFYFPLVDKLAHDLILYAADSWEGNTFFENLKRILSSLVKDQYLLKQFMIDFAKLITDMVSTYLHELVHVKQHYNQQLKQMPGGGYRQNTEYRSYLANREKFLKSFSKNAANEYVDIEMMNRLHASSPQEIGAYVNNIAIDVINLLFLESYSKEQLIQYYKQSSKDISDLSKLIVEAVNNHLRSRNVLPNTKTEKRIYQRYYKMVSLIVNNYIDYLIKKKQQPEEIGG